MTIKELSKVLEDNKVDSCEYALRSLGQSLRSDAGTIIYGPYNGTLDVIYQNRAKTELLGRFDDEHEACMCLLKDLVPGYPSLQKYIS